MIYGSGTQTRDFIYVDDVVEALIAAATANGINREVINIGTGVGSSINQAISCLEEVTRKKAKVVVSPSISGGVSNLVADTSKAQKLLNFKPKTTLAKGLALLKEHDPQFVT